MSAPVDVIAIRRKAGEPYDFRTGGSDASGIVYAIGEQVKSVAVGDRVRRCPRAGTRSKDDCGLKHSG